MSKRCKHSSRGRNIQAVFVETCSGQTRRISFLRNIVDLKENILCLPLVTPGYNHSSEVIVAAGELEQQRNASTVGFVVFVDVKNPKNTDKYLLQCDHINSTCSSFAHGYRNMKMRRRKIEASFSNLKQEVEEQRHIGICAFEASFCCYWQPLRRIHAKLAACYGVNSNWSINTYILQWIKRGRFRKAHHGPKKIRGSHTHILSPRGANSSNASSCFRRSGPTFV